MPVSHIAHDEEAGSLNLSPKGAAKFYLSKPSCRKVSSDVDAWKKVSVDVQSLNIVYKLTDNINLKSVTTRKQTSFELDLSVQLTDYLSLRSGLGYINIEFDEFYDVK